MQAALNPGTLVKLHVAPSIEPPAWIEKRVVDCPEGTKMVAGSSNNVTCLFSSPTPIVMVVESAWVVAPNPRASQVPPAGSAARHSRISWSAVVPGKAPAVSTRFDVWLKRGATNSAVANTKLKWLRISLLNLSLAHSPLISGPRCCRADILSGIAEYPHSQLRYLTPFAARLATAS